MRTVFFSGFLLLALVSCRRAEPEAIDKFGDVQSNPLRVTLVDLIVNPKKYDSKWVSVQGYLDYPESNTPLLFFNKESYDHGDDSGAVFLSPKMGLKTDEHLKHGAWVRVVGTFEKDYDLAFPHVHGTIRVSQIEDISDFARKRSVSDKLPAGVLGQP